MEHHSFSHKETSSEEIDTTYQVLIDGISDHMAVLVHTDKYDDINTTDTTTMGYYVLK